MKSVDEVDPEFGYQMGLRVHQLASAVIDPNITNEELGSRIRAFVREESPHTFGMIAQMLWDRLRPEPDFDDDEEDDTEDETEDDIADCPHCGTSNECGPKGLPAKPCTECGFDFKTGRIPCSGCGQKMHPDETGAVIVETKQDGQQIYHEACKPTQDLVGDVKPARHPEKRP